MKYGKMLVFLFLVWFPFFTLVLAAPGDALWAKSVISAPNTSGTYAVATDSSGNIYIVGEILGANGTFDFGNGATLTTTTSAGEYCYLIKYDSNGNAQWVKGLTSGWVDTEFNSVATDSSGNVYVSGKFSEGGDTIDFGNGVTVSGAYTVGTNAVLVKYDSSGNAQWAKSTTSGSSTSQFYSLDLDSSGNIYVAGTIDGAGGAYGFGNGVTVSGAYTVGNRGNILLVKYNSSGDAQWAKSTTSATGDSDLNSVATDSSGNVYVCGGIDGTDTYGLGDGVTVSGPATENLLLAKYDSSGNAQWAKSVTSGSDKTFAYGLAVDDSGNVYVGGYMLGSGIYNFGNNITVSGAFSGQNALLVQYDSTGNAQWAKSTTSATADSRFLSIATDSNGNIYVSGLIDGTNTFRFGNSVTVNGAVSGGRSVLLIGFDSQGEALWAKSTTSATSNSGFRSVAIDSSRNVYASGWIYETSTFNFGSGVTVNGAYGGTNFVLVKYVGTPASRSSDASSLGSNMWHLLGGSIGAILMF